MQLLNIKIALATLPEVIHRYFSHKTCLFEDDTVAPLNFNIIVIAATLLVANVSCFQIMILSITFNFLFHVYVCTYIYSVLHNNFKRGIINTLIDIMQLKNPAGALYVKQPSHIRILYEFFSLSSYENHWVSLNH